MARKTEREDSSKTRNWVSVVYPESAPEGWRDVLNGWCCRAFVSPLHDRDMNPDGTAKKAHWHVMVMWDGPVTRRYAEQHMKEFGGVGCQVCNSARGYARYLCHLDNPEKTQYPVDMVEAYGGADYLEVIALDSDRRKIIAEMMDWATENRCCSFQELCDYARANRDSWFRCLTSNSTMIMYRYLRSMEHRMKEQAKVPETIPEESRKIVRASKAASDEAKREGMARNQADPYYTGV